MSKRKTLKKPVRSLNDMPTLKAKDKTKFTEFRASKRIRNKKYVSKALLECLVANGMSLKYGQLLSIGQCVKIR